MKIKLSDIIKYLRLHHQKGLASTLPLLITAISLIVPLIIGNINKDDLGIHIGSETGKKVLATTTTSYTNLTVCIYHNGGGLINGTITISGYSTVSTNGGCYKYTFVSGKTLTITSSASGHYQQTKSLTLTPGANQVNFYLNPIVAPPAPAPTLYTKLVVCIYKSGGGQIDGTVSIAGYKKQSTPADGCASYTFIRGESVNITASAPNYTPKSQSVHLSSASQTVNIYLSLMPKPIISYKITGSVKDKMGAAIDGASVTVVGSTTTATTNPSGNYVLTLKSTESPYAVTLRAGKKGFNNTTSPAISLTAVANTKAYNFTLVKPAITTTPTPKGTITGTVFVETANGQRAYVGGNVRVTLNVLLGIGNPATTLTKSTGSYKFTGLNESDKYTVKIDPPATYEVTTGNPVTATTTDIVNFRMKLKNTAGTSDNTIKGTAFHDNNNNGVKDDKDIVFPNIKINLGKTVTMSTKTATNGTYVFSALPPGDYTIRPEIPSGYKASHSWPNGQVGGSTKSLTRNFGIIYTITPSPVKAKTVTGHLFFDKNANGIVDENPVNGDHNGGTGFNGMSLKLSGSNISLTTKTVASSISNGNYTFKDIKPGAYTITLQTIPNGHTLSSSQAQQITIDETINAPKPVNFLLKTSGNLTQPSTSPSINNPSPSTGTQPSTAPITNPPTTPTSVQRKVVGKIWLQSTTNKKVPYTNASVEITATNTINQTKKTKTKNDGTYELNPLTKLNYTIRITVPANTKLLTANDVPITFTATQSTKTINFTLGELATLTITQQPPSSPIPTSPVPVCLQVITSARNSTTNACQTFPTSCLPTGWVNDPTCALTPTVTIAPTVTSIPTATPVPNATRLSFTVFLHGIGNSGDNINPTQSLSSNKTPLHPQRTLTIDVFDNSGKSILTKTGLVTLDANNGNFKGIIDIGTTLPTGQYTIKIKSPQYLKKQIPGIQTINAGQIQEIPTITLTAGDISNDNSLSILDYNILVGCYSDFEPPVSCSETGGRDSDLNDDGKVNQLDYNLFLRNLSEQYGD